MSPGSNISPVCVPDEDEELDEHWSCVTTGWGLPKATGSVHTQKHKRLVLNTSDVVHTEPP